MTKAQTKRQTITESQAAAIYLSYPRRIGRLVAIKAIKAAFKLLCKDKRFADGAEILAYLTERVDTFSRSEKARSGFCPHPSTFFNQGRYDDDPSEWNPTRRQSYVGGPKIHVASQRDKSADEYDHAKRVVAAMSDEDYGKHVKEINKAIPMTAGRDTKSRVMIMMVAKRAGETR